MNDFKNPEHIKNFCSPYSINNHNILNNHIGILAKSSFSTVIDKLIEMGDEKNESIIAFYENYLDADLPYAEQSYRAELGYGFSNVANHDNVLSDINVGLAQMALIANLMGYVNSWSCDFENAGMILILGETYFFNSRIECVSSKDKLKIIIDNNEITEIYYDSDLKNWLFLNQKNLFITLSGRALQVIFTNDDNKSIFVEDKENPISKDVNKDDAIKEIQRSMNYLEQQSPVYAEWVSKVLKQVVLIGQSDGKSFNRSSSSHPGTIFLSYPSASPNDFPQIFVHESTHNYLHIVTCMMNIINNKDTKMYFSKIKRAERPLSAILATYHAFGNVQIFLKECIDNKANFLDYNNTEYDAYKDILTPLHDYLVNSNGFTEQGESLWQPLSLLLEHAE